MRRPKTGLGGPSGRPAVTLLSALLLLVPSVLPALAAFAAVQALAVSGVDLSIAPSGLELPASDVFAGDAIWVNTTMRNAGDAPGNVTLEVLVGSPPTGPPLASSAVSVPPGSNLTVPLLVDTTGLLGIQTVTARLVAFSPPENGTPADNSVSASLRVHSNKSGVELRVQGSETRRVTAGTYTLVGFVTVRDNASLTIGAGGRVFVSQGRPDEFDVLVEGNGLLRLDSGVLESNFSIAVELRGNGSLAVENGGVLRASVAASTSGSVRFTGGRVEAPRFEVRGASVVLEGAFLSAGAATFEGASLSVSRSTIVAQSSITLRGATVGDFRNTTVSVASTFAGLADAELAFPGVGAFVGWPAAPFQPALWLSGSSTAEFRRTAASSSLLVGGVTVPSSRPIFASEAATATLYRVARVSVTDPIGVPVPNATVEILDYWGAPVALGLALNGTAEVELPSAYLESSHALDTVNYRVVASRGVATSAPIQFAFALYPDLSEASLVKLVPVALALFHPRDLYEGPTISITAPTTASVDLVTSSNLEVYSTLNYNGASITLLQTRPFERYVLVADNASLSMTGGLIRSDYPFDLYLLNGSRLTLTGSGIVAGNLLLQGAGPIRLEGSRLVGSAIGDASSLACQSSFLWGRILQLSLGSLDARDCVAAASEGVTLDASSAWLLDAALSTTFEPFDAANRTSLAFSEFSSLAGSEFATLSASAPLALHALALDASGLTAWTPGSFALSTGATNASLSGLRLLVSQATVSSAGGRTTFDQAFVSPGANLALGGSGYMSLRSVTSPPPTIAAGLTVDFFDTVAASVVDELGLPVEGALVVAVPQATGRATESSTTASDGQARLVLLASTTSAGATGRGPLYRVNATKDGTASVTQTWDPLRQESLSFSLAGNFAQASSEASFALVVPLRAGPWRVLSTNVPNASLVAFLQTFVAQPPTLNFSAAVFASQSARLFVAADYIFSAGGQSVNQPMSGVGTTLDFDGLPSAAMSLGAEGSGSADFFLPPGAGEHTANLTLAAPLLRAPVKLAATFSLRPLTQLLVVANLNKASFKTLEQMTVQGRVTDAAGAPVAGATVRIEISPDRPVRNETTQADGSFFARLVAPTQNGSYQVRVNASGVSALDSNAALFPYVVLASGATLPSVTLPGPSLLPAILAGAVAVLCGAGLVYFYTQRRIAAGHFVVCGSCDKPTPASSKKCTNCGVEFETGVAKCSKCGSWIAPDSAACPQCRTVFVNTRERAPPKDDGITIPEPSRGVAADFDIPESVPLTGQKAGPARLEDLEFKLPGTTDTLDLGEKGSAPIFASAARAPTGPPFQASSSAGRPLERVELPRVEHGASAVREVSPLEGGEPTAKEPVSLGTGNMDLSRTTAAATSTKGEPPSESEIPESVLRELLMKAAPELSDEMLPSDIKKELQEIARSEAPVASERRTAGGPTREGKPAALPPDERTAEVPERSRKSAFEVFSTPAKNIPAGYERKGTAGKEAGAKPAPVCPNCGGNWVVQRDGKNSCRVCGTRW